MELFAGALQGDVGGNLLSELGGVLIADGDFLQASAASIVCTDGGTMQLGNVSRRCNAAAVGEMLNVIGLGSGCEVVPIFAATAVLYGVDAGNAFLVGGNACALRYRNDGGGTPAQTAFLGTTNTFTIDGHAASFGFDQATGLYVTGAGTTNTTPHLDAALGAATGFGGQAVDPGSMGVVAVL